MRLGTLRFRQASSLRRIAYSSDGQLVVTEVEQGILAVRGARDRKMFASSNSEAKGSCDFSLSPDEKTIAIVGFRLEPKRNVVANHLTFTDMATGRTVRRAEWDDQDNVENVAYLPDGKTIATLNIKGILRLWDVTTAKLRHEERLGEGGSREAIVFSRDATSRMLAISWDKLSTSGTLRSSAAPGGSHLMDDMIRIALRSRPMGRPWPRAWRRAGRRSGYGASATAI